MGGATASPGGSFEPLDLAKKKKNTLYIIFLTPK